MQIKTYEATSVQEALEMIKRDLGEDAVVLSTSRRGKIVEVVAALDTVAPQRVTSLPPLIPLDHGRQGMKNHGLCERPWRFSSISSDNRAR